MRKALGLGAVFLVGLAVVGLAVAGLNGRWSTHLAGTFEVPLNDSQGQGQAIFRLSQDGQELEYKLIASNIENPFMAHIHMAGPGANGPIVVWLYSSNGTTTEPQSPPTLPRGTGRTDGVLAEGTIRAASFVGPLAGRPLQVLVDGLDAGAFYVNVHTDDGVSPTGTGPGDLPGGEIRGDIG